MPEQLTYYGNKTEIALHEAQAQYTNCDVDFENKPDWFVKVNPAGKVPAITYGGPSVPPDQPSPESAKIAESVIILEFIADLYPSSGLLPSDPVKRAQARFFIDAVNNKFNPLAAGWMRGGPVNGLVEAIKTLQALLPEDGLFAIGDEFTIADAVIAPAWARLRLIVDKGIGEEFFAQNIIAAREALESPELAKFVAYGNRVLERPSVKASWHEDLVAPYFEKRFDKLLKSLASTHSVTRPVRHTNIKHGSTGGALDGEGIRTVLEFDRPITLLSSCSARIFPTSTAVYAIETTKSFASTKTIVRSPQTGKVVATVARNNLLPDTTTFGCSADGVEEERFKMGKWLNTPKSRPFPLQLELNGIGYVWTLGAGRRLVLKAASATDDSAESDTVLAWHEPVAGTGGRLFLTPEADQIRDCVVVAYIHACLTGDSWFDMNVILLAYIFETS
ncbi:glutathione S-transferase C-terminal-like protein [Coniophora puteana RWD-64-598 SS2]|uniref:Glutathione S-transferase C-terminal-like protein n=1 Tax=Coniophora puteana (strain RWD-64-598) TaxID=741705 RepID=A0A5M3MR25_CONPW|nr:glutathione S-transferase C-terminal-like protein [Coniophora puteana RWD-64-598 SS2]EIW81633.1 glutathione S-transferase C-terminal-like protein [Coniophora puteana RWD-64-598 SS2]